MHAVNLVIYKHICIAARGHRWGEGGGGGGGGNRVLASIRSMHL